MPYYKDPAAQNRVHFLDHASDAGVLPASVIEITEAEALALAAVATPFETLKAGELAKFRHDRKEMFSVIVGMGWAASETGDTVAVTKLLAFREGLKDLPDWPAVVAATTHTGLKTAMAARYKTLTDALPAAIKADFKNLYRP